MTMIKLELTERKHIATLFRGIDDSMVIAYLQGYMGGGWADRIPEPAVALIVSGEYSFPAGDFSSDAAKGLAENIFDYIEGDETTVIFDENEPGWEPLMLSVKKYCPRAVPRFGIVQKDYIFDEKLLQSFIDALPQCYTIKAFDENLYNQAMSEDWAKEFCETFDSAADYLDKGFGFGILSEGRLVSGASTMTVYDGGTETQVATAPDFRGQGLALCSAARFILECQKRKIRPCWDAANLVSKHMALKLGYDYRGEYTTIVMKRN